MLGTCSNLLYAIYIVHSYVHTYSIVTCIHMPTENTHVGIVTLAIDNAIHKFHSVVFACLQIPWSLTLYIVYSAHNIMNVDFCVGKL